MAETAVPLTATNFDDCNHTKTHVGYCDHRKTNDSLLFEQTFNEPLIKQLELASADIALRIWIVDNSSTMNIYDRYRVDNHGIPDVEYSVTQDKRCSRWEELKETVLYHAHLASSLKAPTLFRLVKTGSNTAHEYHIASAKSLYNDCAHRDLHDMEIYLKSMKPTGRTRITNSIYETRPHILLAKKSLQEKHQSVALILATDGLPSDENGRIGPGETELFINALKTLEHLPVILIIRLSTDDELVRNFYCELKYSVKIRIIMLRDFLSEIKQVQAVNPWMIYTPEIHRIREFGHAPTCLQFLAERKLTHVEMRDACIFLLGYDTINGILDPISDWYWFLQYLKHSMSSQSELRNKNRNQMRPIIDLDRLIKAYRPTREQRRCNSYIEKLRFLFRRR